MNRATSLLDFLIDLQERERKARIRVRKIRFFRKLRLNRSFEDLGTYLQSLRGDLPQKVFAERARVSQPYICYLEQGQIHKFSEEALLRMLQVYADHEKVQNRADSAPKL